MGMSFFKSCNTNSKVSAPNPNNWKLLNSIFFNNSYVLKVKYPDCTNFEGIKVMVFMGKYQRRETMDPHFDNSINSPVARFRPDGKGWNLAILFAESLSISF